MSTPHNKQEETCGQEASKGNRIYDASYGVTTFIAGSVFQEKDEHEQDETETYDADSWSAATFELTG